MDKTELFNRIKGKLIISCQALPGEPLYDPERSLMPYMARAAREAGSPMIRANTVRDVLGIKRETGLPVIGLIKRVYEGFDGYITPTMGEVDALAARFRQLAGPPSGPAYIKTALSIFVKIRFFISSWDMVVTTVLLGIFTMNMP